MQSAEVARNFVAAAGIETDRSQSVVAVDTDCSRNHSGSQSVGLVIL